MAKFNYEELRKNGHVAGFLIGTSIELIGKIPFTDTDMEDLDIEITVDGKSVPADVLLEVLQNQINTNRIHTLKEGLNMAMSAAGQAASQLNEQMDTALGINKKEEAPEGAADETSDLEPISDEVPDQVTDDAMAEAIAYAEEAELLDE